MSATASPPAGISPVVQLFYARTGIEFSATRQRSVEHAIRRAMARAGATDEADFAQRLGGDEAAFDDLVSELTVGETYFFRVPQQFAFMRSRVLPELRRRSATGQPVRAWSSACSSGEESYSLAMMFEEEGLGDGASILATDISREALRKAAAASYTNWSFRGTDPRMLTRYFRMEGNRHLLADRIRQRVNFRYLNLSADLYPSLHNDTSAMDLVLCRNVLIYFSPDVVAHVCRQLFASLAEGGWLVTAPTDPPIDRFVPCEVVVDELGVFYRRRKFATSSAIPTRPTPAREQVLQPVVLPSLPLAAPPGGRRGREECLHSSGAPSAAAAPQRRPIAGPLDGSPLTQASILLHRGDFGGALAVLASSPLSPEACALRTRVLVNIDIEQAMESCVEGVTSHPLSAELSFLNAVLLLHAGRLEPSAAAMRRTLYLDPSLAIAHFVFGTVLQRQAKPCEARLAYRNARDLCQACAPDDELALGEGETAGRLAMVAAAQLSVLEG